MIMSPVLQKIEEDIDSLSSEEKLGLLRYLQNKLVIKDLNDKAQSFYGILKGDILVDAQQYVNNLREDRIY